MFCPNCRDEFRPGFTHCAKCNVDLVDELESHGGLTGDDQRVVERADGSASRMPTEFCASAKRLGSWGLEAGNHFQTGELRHSFCRLWRKNNIHFDDPGIGITGGIG